MYESGKRLLDIIGAVVGIVVFAPIMLCTAVFIKIVSPNGPVLADSKPRVGKNWKEFRMFKFRSMRPKAQEWLRTQKELYAEYQRNGYKLENDPRLIKGAKFIRKMSIDEMPQFYNILMGNMSLVGPRAYFRYELDEQLERFPHLRDYVEQALTVKPGLTGPWQIGGRSEINFEERIKMDAEYAKTKSLIYDISIILKTPLVVLTGKGAV